MKFTKTSLPDVYVIDLEKRQDERGFFARTWCRKEFENLGLDTEFAQANLAFSNKKKTLRGMHYQVAPHAETKLVRCVRGAIYDVALDMREDSPTYKHWFGLDLTAENRKMLYVPKGFAHGYLTLEDNSEVLYQVSEFYAPESERGLRWDDPAFAIQWPKTENLLISEKDAGWGNFSG